MLNIFVYKKVKKCKLILLFDFKHFVFWFEQAYNIINLCQPFLILNDILIILNKK